MKRVAIDSLHLQNFKSFEAATTVEMPGGGFIYLGGINEVEPRLGANGAGKSSLWDAIVFCLYGSDALGSRASDLVTWGKKRPYVSMMFIIDGESYQIDRWGNPNALHLEGSAAEQRDLDELLGLTKERFLQSILFAQKAPQFLDMNAASRGELMDSILSLGGWLEKAELAGKMAKGYAEEIARLEADKAAWQRTLPSAELSAEVHGKLNDWDRQHSHAMSKVTLDLHTIEKKLVTCKRDFDRARKTVLACEDPNEFEKEIAALRRELSDLEKQNAVADAEYQRNLKQQFFLRDNKTCTTCGQPIADKVRLTQHKQLGKDADALLLAMSHYQKKAKSTQEEIDELVAETRARSEAHKLAQAQSNELRFEFDKLTIERQSLSNEHTRILAERNPHEGEVNRLHGANEEAARELARLNQALGREGEEYRRMDYWKVGFKRVRLFLIKQALDVLQLETNNAAQQLGLSDYMISYVTETETKSGSMKLGVQVIVDAKHIKGPWRLPSGGEEQRVRMAVTIGIAGMIKRMAQVQFDLEVWDEPTAHLSPEGITDMLECLRARADASGKPLFISDHQVLNYTGFDATWIVRKDASGSKLEAT